MAYDHEYAERHHGLQGMSESERFHAAGRGAQGMSDHEGLRKCIHRKTIQMTEFMNRIKCASCGQEWDGSDYDEAVRKVRVIHGWELSDTRSGDVPYELLAKELAKRVAMNVLGAHVIPDNPTESEPMIVNDDIGPKSKENLKAILDAYKKYPNGLLPGAKRIQPKESLYIHNLFNEPEPLPLTPGSLRTVSVEEIRTI